MRTLTLAIGGIFFTTVSIAQTTPANLERYKTAKDDRVKFDPKYTPDIRSKLRLLNHFRYEEAPLDKLVTLDKAFSAGPRSCDMMPDAANAVVELVRAADKYAVSINSNLRLRAGSCFRSIDEQVAIFCSMRSETQSECFEPVGRALTSAPSGFSEHATGYTLDFFVRRLTSSGDVDPGLCEPNDSEPCKGQIEKSPFGQWLKDNGPAHGFELSFPCAIDNQRDPIKNRTICLSRQRVMYEPWHWRWVGKNLNEPGAKGARVTFAAARACFAAKPAVDGPIGACGSTGRK